MAGIIMDEEKRSDSYRERFRAGSALSKWFSSFFGWAARHVEHPGPKMSFSPGEAPKQAEQAHVAQHLQGTDLTEVTRTTRGVWL